MLKDRTERFAGRSWGDGYSVAGKRTKYGRGSWGGGGGCGGWFSQWIRQKENGYLLLTLDHLNNTLQLSSYMIYNTPCLIV